MTVHEYRAVLVWAGSTGHGYAGYDRAHRVVLAPASAELAMSSDPAFRGDASLLNPEQLLTAAVSSCQLLSFLALAARSRIDVVSYTDTAVATMPMSVSRIETVVLAPVISVRPPADVARVVALVHEAHETCYIARSLKTEIRIEPDVRILDAAQ